MTIEEKIKKNYDLADLTTFRIGGKAQYFLSVKNTKELIEAANWAKIKKLSLSFLAGGSNILIANKMVRGLVIKISGEQYSIKKNMISSWAGTGLTKLSRAASNHRLSGLEWALGVPGSLGGAVRGNAGAYGSDISGQVAEVEAFNIIESKLKKFDNLDCGFSYRHSIFKQNNNLIIINVKLKLSQGRSADITNLAERNFKKRLEKNPKEPSAGSIFKNLEFKKLIKQNSELAKELEAKGLVRGGKIAVAYLIDQLGLKGKIRGGAKISEKHANFIVNTGTATAKDVVGLINLIKKKVKTQYKIKLEEEIQYFGS